jgi:tRNA pseudouridine55 synthase
MELPKEYEVVVQFGATSSTADPTGTIAPTGMRVDEEHLSAALEGFRGRIRQKVPLTSAVKVSGEALYRRAHRGESVPTPEREVMVYDILLREFDPEAQTATLLVTTGKGTYVRVIAEDLGRVTGAGAYAAALRRTRSGVFRVEEALRPDDLCLERYLANGPGVYSLEEALAFLPSYRLEGRQAQLAANGNRITGTPLGRFRVYGPDGLIGIYEGRGEFAQPLVVFPKAG